MQKGVVDVVLRAIETRWKGYRFRSRGEARWAVFFDTLGCTWEYEREGYDLGAAGWYLPDFWLPTVEMWAEVKGDRFTDEERHKCKALVEVTGFDCLMLDGTPTPRPYLAYCAPYEGMDDPEIYENDFILGREYLFSERRFYGACACNCAWQKGSVECSHHEFAFDMDAYHAARSARFEHEERER